METKNDLYCLDDNQIVIYMEQLSLCKFNLNISLIVQKDWATGSVYVNPLQTIMLIDFFLKWFFSKTSIWETFLKTAFG